MNGQLSEQPLAELIREIALKSISGGLRLQYDRIKVAAYFNEGNFVYAASNLRTLRLHEYLQKSGLVSDQDLARFDDRRSDLELARMLCAEKVLTPAAAEQVQTLQVADVLRMALLWTDGVWEFDHRSHLTEGLTIKIDAGSLLLDAGRRMPSRFAASRFCNSAELISPVAAPYSQDNLMPTEVFLLSRLDRPMPLSELVAVSGMAETETLSLIYSLALTGLLKREHWKSAFRSQQPLPKTVAEKGVPEEPANSQETSVATDDTGTFLNRLSNAQSHYDALGVDQEASPPQLKAAYYEIARRYHPDRFRQAETSLLARIESAFAQITQAYDTLRDERLRATYNSKLAARKKAQQLAETAPKAAAPATPAAPGVDGAPDTGVSSSERAEIQFKEGFAALELGQRNVATGLFASAARLVPTEPRYRAFYGHMLAAQESTRRAAEAELQAAIKLDPRNSEYRVMLAELFRDLGFMVRARGEAERAVASDPNNRKARDLLQALK